MYIYHHISTALVYISIIWSGGRLSVLGCFGLLYEVLWRMSLPCATADPHPLPRVGASGHIQHPRIRRDLQRGCDGALGCGHIVSAP